MHPIIASVSSTFTMALMVICVFIRWDIYTNAAWINVLWIGAVILHFILMIYFCSGAYFSNKKSNWNIFIQAGLLRLSALALFLILLNCLSMSWEKLFLGSVVLFIYSCYQF